MLLSEVIELFVQNGGRRLLDGTFGGGGHTKALLDSSPDLEIVALDQDPQAIERSAPLSQAYGDRFHIIHTNFAELKNLELGQFDGVFFDFGLSSFQLDAGERGFSFREDAPLDMRMNPEQGQSAAQFLESADEASLVEAIRNFGEESRWRRVVSAIIEARDTGKLQRTQSFAKLVADLIGTGQARGRRFIHPATRTFQGVRIAVNKELSSIEKALPAAFDILNEGGILAAIAFHSLEDRILKRFCRQVAGRPEHSRDSRVQSERSVRARMIATKPIKPAAAEIAANPRSRSARLRAVQKIS